MAINASNDMQSILLKRKHRHVDIVLILNYLQEQLDFMMTEMIFCSKTTHSRYDNSRHMNILHFFATLSRIVSKEFTMLLIFFIVS